MAKELWICQNNFINFCFKIMFIQNDDYISVYFFNLYKQKG